MRATDCATEALTYTEIKDIIPAGTAVMLESVDKTSGEYTLTSTKEKASYTGTNMLNGSDESTITSSDNNSCLFYKLAFGHSGTDMEKVFGWYWGAQNGAPFQIDGHKAWLVIPRVASRGFTIDGEALGIVSSENDESKVKFFDLQGRHVDNPSKKGLYIMNGKKVVIK